MQIRMYKLDMAHEASRQNRDSRLCIGGREHSPVSTFDEFSNLRRACIACGRYLDSTPGTGYEEDGSHYFNDDGY